MPHYDPDRHHRRSIRWRGYDYGSQGTCFVTLAIQSGLPLLGEIKEGIMHPSYAGMMMLELWKTLPERFSFLSLDVYGIMPDHLHGLLTFHKDASSASDPRIDQRTDTGDQDGKRPRGTQDGSLGRVIQAFKSQSTILYGEKVREEGWLPYEKRLWQRNYYDHVVRNQRELNAIREYIRRNPENWHQSQ